MASQMAPQQSETVTAQLQVDDYKLRASGSKVVLKALRKFTKEAKKDGDETKINSYYGGRRYGSE